MAKIKIMQTTPRDKNYANYTQNTYTTELTTIQVSYINEEQNPMQLNLLEREKTKQGKNIPLTCRAFCLHTRIHPVAMRLQFWSTSLRKEALDFWQRPTSFLAISTHSLCLRMVRAWGENNENMCKEVYEQQDDDMNMI